VFGKNHMRVGILLLMLSAQVLVQAADSPIAPGSKPKNEGKIGAGEGPAWHPEEYPPMPEVVAHGR